MVHECPLNDKEFEYRCSNCICERRDPDITTVGEIFVPSVELQKLEESRIDIFTFLQGRLSEYEMFVFTAKAEQIRKVANTKKWD